MQLYKRQYSLSVRDGNNVQETKTTLTQHRISFEVEQTSSKFTDKMTCTIYNPSRATIKAFQEDAYVILEAGYTNVGTYGILFKGTVRKVDTVMDAQDLKLTFTAVDRPKDFHKARINVTAAPGTTLLDVLDILMLQFRGVDVDAARRKLTDVAADTLWGAARHATAMDTKVFKGGLVLNGKVTDVFNRLLRRTSPRIKWSIQDGALAVAPGGTVTKSGTTAIVLSDKSGMIGSPSIGEKGRLTATSLLQPALKPFRIVKMEDTRFVNGFYRTIKVKHKGDTHSNTWFSIVEMKKV